MKHLSYLTQQAINKMEVGEEFTYRDGKFFKKGLKVTKDMMIPVGLLCTTRESAEKTY